MEAADVAFDLSTQMLEKIMDLLTEVAYGGVMVESWDTKII